MPRKKSPAKDVSFSQFAGVNNVQAPERLDLKELREAMNVDIDDSGRVRRRSGFSKIYTGANCHSFWSNGVSAYFVEGASLQRLESDFTATTLRSDLQENQRMSYVVANDGAVYFMDGSSMGKVGGDGTASEWGLVTPQVPSLSATAGSLPAGRYSATVTVQTLSGMESGARASATIDLSSDGGLLFSNLPNDSNAAYVNIYMTPWNSEVLHLAAQVPMGTSSYAITNPYDLGRQLRTQYLDRPTPGRHLVHFDGRIFFAVGSILYYTIPFAYHLVDYRMNFIRFPSDITAVGAVDDGLYIGADHTYFIAGSKPEEFQVLDISPDVIVSYTMATVQASKILKEGDQDVLVWTGHRGVYVGAEGGRLTNVTEDRFVPNPATEGTAVIRDRDGSDQYAALLKDTNDSPDGFYASDVAVAEVYRNGVLVP